MGAGDEAADALVPACKGRPFDPSLGQSVSEWSAAIYEELRGWASEYGGRWEFWPPDFLVLTIDAVRGAPIEPIVIDTAEDELTITFGYWEAHLPNDGVHDDTDSSRAAAKAMEMAVSWFDGTIATAVFFNSAGKWCKSKMVDEPIDPMELAAVTRFAGIAPTRVEIRRSRRSQWRDYQISNGELIDPR